MCRGAALPTNTPSIPCIFDPHGRAGICGDWLLGSSVESAALSGMALANHIADYLGSGGVRPEEFAVGLHNEFQSLEGHDIGQFPGNVISTDAKESGFFGQLNPYRKLVFSSIGDRHHDISPAFMEEKQKISNNCKPFEFSTNQFEYEAKYKMQIYGLHSEQQSSMLSIVLSSSDQSFTRHKHA
ncbi:hypothetical protein CUMW_168570 [Citrus unshiu]|uniref:Amine oxidase domain-containing protein n=1 Tax=Citrus unshiu TaxID=55188 RepID=A0A2H5PVB4_CITUN|nr:hypothetical protein CUMW_168570 [Citrus unshiu]